MRVSAPIPGPLPPPVRAALAAAGYVLDAATPRHRRLFAKEAARLWGRTNPPPDGKVVKAAEQLVRTRVLDRLHAAVEAGVIDLDDTDDETGAVMITRGEFVTLLQVMHPEEHPGELALPVAVDAPPGSPEKIQAMQARLARGEALYTPCDPGMSNQGRAARIVERRNGSGRRVLGWDSPPAAAVTVGEAATGVQKAAPSPVPDPLGWVPAASW
jgi:hypothetical protein